ncbi:hypothetical protein CHUV2995_02718 [Corynebacterium diphtheriae subsp. lausannense]|nr:hypothetical protein CHUV2995_02718 [Corynebacterium diphtheriae subsp. lausannense]
MQPNGNAIVDTICRTAELGATITKATEHGNSYRHQSRAHRAHQRMPHMQAAKKAMSTLIDTLAGMKDTGIAEIAQLGRTMNKRRKDTLAYFDHKVSNGPVEAINGRLEHLRGIALGFKNLNHYILRCLIHAANIQHKINAL